MSERHASPSSRRRSTPGSRPPTPTTRTHRAGGFGMTEPRILPVPPRHLLRVDAQPRPLGGQNKVPRIVNDRELSRRSGRAPASAPAVRRNSRKLSTVPKQSSPRSARRRAPARCRNRINPARALLTGRLFWQLVLETACVVSKDAALYFNERGRFFKFTNYYQPSTAWLDYVLRIMGSQILDVEYVDPLRLKFDRKRISRVAMTCILSDDSILEADDEWAAKRLSLKELAEFAPVRKDAPVDLFSRLSPDRYALGLY
jgi:hypothetical protein